MAIQYYMRGWYASGGYFVDWVVNDQPDSTGTYAPVTGLTNIIVNRIVQSKINNFVKPVIEPTFIDGYSYNNPQDGYLFHLNSYDWLHPTLGATVPGPVTVPSANQPVGISVVRGTLSLDPPFTPSNYASLFWEEGTQLWNFNFINSDGSIGSPLGVSMGNLVVDGYELIDGYLIVTDSLSDYPAQSGLIRLPNNQSIKARNSLGSGVGGADITMVSTDSQAGGNNVILGDASHNVIIGGTAANTIGSPALNTTTIAGDLLVLGSTTTVESTIVDIVGRVIHANWSTSYSPPVAPPSMIAGYSVHRGATGDFSIVDGYFQNDGAAWIWTEGAQVVSGADGYWRAATIPGDGYSTDGYTIANSPNALSVMASSFVAVPTSTMQMTGAQLITAGLLPGTGGLRVQNNTTAVAARNAASSADILLLGTDTSNHIVMGALSSPQNAGFIFNTPSNDIFDYWVNSTSEVQMGYDSNGPFVRESASTYSVATGGFIRLANATSGMAAKTVNFGAVNNHLLGTDSNDHIIMGYNSSQPASVHNNGFIFNTTSGSVFDYQYSGTSELQLGFDANGAFIRPALSLNPAVTGLVRTQNGTVAVAARNSGNSADISLIGTDSANHIVLGASVAPSNAGFIFDTPTGDIFDFWVSGSSTIQLSQDNIAFTGTDGYATISQLPTYVSAATGALMTVAAQSALGALGVGGNLALTSGFGSVLDGYVALQVGGTGVVEADPVSGGGTFAFLGGRRRHITHVDAVGDGYVYQVVPTDDYIAVTDLLGMLVIDLPSFPVLGDEYEIKDTTGNAGAYNIVVSGNGNFIDGAAIFILEQPYAAASFTWTGSAWSVT